MIWTVKRQEVTKTSSAKMAKATQHFKRRSQAMKIHMSMIFYEVALIVAIPYTTEKLNNNIEQEAQ